jgi:hypothetical protein
LLTSSLEGGNGITYFTQIGIPSLHMHFVQRASERATAFGHFVTSLLLFVHLCFASRFIQGGRMSYQHGASIHQIQNGVTQ